MHVMQMSGGAHDDMMVMNYGWAFLQKPFVAKRLVEMITEVLHTPDRSQVGGASFDSRLDTNPASPKQKIPRVTRQTVTNPRTGESRQPFLCAGIAPPKELLFKNFSLFLEFLINL